MLHFTIVPAASTPRRASALIPCSPHSKCTDESTRGLPPRARQVPPCPTASYRTFDAAEATSAIAVTVGRSGSEGPDCLAITLAHDARYVLLCPVRKYPPSGRLALSVGPPHRCQ